MILMKYLDGDTTEAGLRELYQSIHFEDLNYSGSFWLACLSDRLQFKGVPEQYLPRIKGVIRSFTMENAMLLSELTGILKNLSGINLLLLGSSAMRVYYRRNNIRKFEFLQAYADEEHTDVISRGLQENGWNLTKVSNHLSFEKNGIFFELYHSVFYDYIPQKSKSFDWHMAIQTEYQMQKVYVPCPELMVLSLLKSAFDSAITTPSEKTLWIHDLNFFRESENDAFRKALCMAEEYGISLEVQTMSDLFCRITSASAIGTVSKAEYDEKSFFLLAKLAKANDGKSLSPINRLMKSCYMRVYKRRKQSEVDNGE